ncbi:hypothetical protein RAH41_18870 [Gottfriedia acidiceleris]|uniref:hypothetical protein n=1 Tax=Gottfriedia acidiceleris TaxID=371036 RepID=UPI002F26D102
MSLLKKYGRWLFKNNARRYDLAELLSWVIFFPLIMYGTKFLHNYSMWVNLLILFLAINLFQLGYDLLRGILGKFNAKIPKWMSAITFACFIIYIFFSDF